VKDLFNSVALNRWLWIAQETFGLAMHAIIESRSYVARKIDLS